MENSIEKQIEEMARDLCECYNSDGSCCQDDKPCDLRCDEYTNAQYLYDKGYRKASDVARETVEAIKAEARKKEQYVNDLFGYGGYVIATTDLEDIIRRFMFDNYEEAELKKKYTEEGK